MKAPRFLVFVLIFGASHAAEIKRIPPPGIAVPEDVRAELTTGVAALEKEIDALRSELAGKPELLARLPDVLIFHKAVDWALRYDEFFEAKQIDSARKQLALGIERARALREGRTPWDEQTGLVVRGYLSQIDGSVQPYGLVVPIDWKPDDRSPRRLDVWFRGRSEKGTELSFLEDRMKNKGEFAPEGAIVMHPFGRYCNANKFAGETDLFEALADLKKHYAIDENRLVVRGFSMGGASTWQFATHHSGMWAAAAPGAGFAETAEFFHSFAPGKTPPPWWEQVLWRWYDSTTMAGNLANTNVVAYSGEIDGQKQAADIMLRFAEKEGLNFPHIIGPQTAHKYHPDAKPKIEEFVTVAVEKGRDAQSKTVRFTTYSLIYPQIGWVRVLGFEKEWERADVEAEPTPTGASLKTKNVSEIFVSPLAKNYAKGVTPSFVIDGTALPGTIKFGGDYWQFNAHKEGGKWLAGIRYNPAQPPIKRPGLCGPIDHAFMSRFLFVRPTGKPLNDAVGAWAKSEMEHAQRFWRQVFRGDAPIKDDNAITPDDIENANLILWGDPSSNAVLKQIHNRVKLSRDLPQLPIFWTSEQLDIGGQRYDPAHHAPALIFPNPLNPQKYVVLNSGPTFREEALLNNSDQTPKLPDWAIVNLDTPPDGKWPGLIVDAGFFDEQWRLPKK